MPGSYTTEEICLDQAEALNAAHERRVTKWHYDVGYSSFNCKSACGQDDCGKEL